MKLLVVLPTKSLHDPLLVLGADYLKRLRPPFSAQTIFLNPKATESLEGKELLAKTVGYFRIALTESGKHYNSDEFARTLERYQLQNPKIAFIIGGASGLAPEVIKSCDSTLSLSAMTMPHRMAFLVLAEQIYRAREISFGSPYHK